MKLKLIWNLPCSELHMHTSFKVNFQKPQPNINPERISIKVKLRLTSNPFMTLFFSFIIFWVENAAERPNEMKASSSSYHTRFHLGFSFNKLNMRGILNQKCKHLNKDERQRSHDMTSGNIDCLHTIYNDSINTFILDSISFCLKNFLWIITTDKSTKVFCQQKRCDNLHNGDDMN